MITLGEQAEQKKTGELTSNAAVTAASYAEVFRCLQQLRVPYVITSGMAVVLHGHQRPTFDLDIVISPKPEEQSRALQALMMAGFVPTVVLPAHFITVLRMFDQSEREIDLFFKYHIPFAQLWPASIEVALGETVVRVASLEHLIKAKRITGRPHDLTDVEGLLRLS